ncbi:MAG: hypothetical protein AB7P20_13905 [Rhizobiaceae bacterium]
MSVHTIETLHRTGLAHWLDEIRNWLRHARAALNTRHQPLDNLSDRDLNDVALRQTDIGRLVDRDKNWILQASLTRAHSRQSDQF